MMLTTELYAEQAKRWPAEGRHILAHFDERSIVVYQAYRPSIGRHAIEHGSFGGGFSYSRMSWIKPNFLWMMYRSGWGTKEGQEITLGLRLRREFFDRILAQAVWSTFDEEHCSSPDAWRQSLATSSVRLQWDPDHDPSGAKLPRRAIQLGLRNDMLKSFGTNELLEVINLTAFVAEQRPHAAARDFSALRTPLECVYVPSSPDIRRHIGLTGGCA